jgi:hypothetical protein
MNLLAQSPATLWTLWAGRAAGPPPPPSWLRRAAGLHNIIAVAVAHNQSFQMANPQQPKITVAALISAPGNPHLQARIDELPPLDAEASRVLVSGVPRRCAQRERERSAPRPGSHTYTHTCPTTPPQRQDQHAVPPELRGGGAGPERGVAGLAGAARAVAAAAAGGRVARQRRAGLHILQVSRGGGTPSPSGGGAGPYKQRATAAPSRRPPHGQAGSTPCCNGPAPPAAGTYPGWRA